MSEEPERLDHVLGRWSFLLWWGLILSRRACCLECFSPPFPEKEILDFLLVRTAEHARGIRLEATVAKTNIIPHTWRVLYGTVLVQHRVVIDELHHNRRLEEIGLRRQLGQRMRISGNFSVKDLCFGAP